MRSEVKYVADCLKFLSDGSRKLGFVYDDFARSIFFEKRIRLGAILAPALVPKFDYFGIIVEPSQRSLDLFQVPWREKESCWILNERSAKLSRLSQRHDACPFVNLPEKKRTQWALTREEMKNCVWLRPELVAQIEFGEWTPDGHLRHSKFVGLREDKDPRNVVCEE